MTQLVQGKLFSVAIAAILCTAGSNFACANEVRPLVRMAVDVGGDTIVDLIYTNGDTTTLKGGQLVTFSGGLVYRPQGKDFMLEATLGYKFDKANGSNGTVEFTRFPLDVIASYPAGSHRVGGGLTFHMNPKYRCDVSGVCADNIQFSNAMGLVLQYGYNFGTGFDVGARVTSIKYKPQGGGPELDGSGVGFFFGFVF
jgi:hypothetical protein